MKSQSKGTTGRESLRRCRVVAFSVLCCVLLLVGCAGPATIWSDRCQGFPFDKKFPGYHKKPLGIFYYKQYCWVIGDDCIRYDFAVDDKKSPDWPYPGRGNLYNAYQLPHSDREKRYLAWYGEREREFDRKYAGWIKKKLLLATEWTVYDRKRKKAMYMTGAEFFGTWEPLYKKGVLCGPGPRPKGATCEAGWFTLEYPRYLTGEKLPHGLQTPATFFSSRFLASVAYIGRNGQEKWDDFAESLRLAVGSGFMHAAGTVTAMGGWNLQSRLDIVFAEYVLTHYYLKNYSSRAEREQVARDMAEYYSMIAFRATAEQGYCRRDILSNREICSLANYTSEKMYDYILTAFLEPDKLNEIREIHQKLLNNICWDNIEDISTPTPWKDMGMTLSKWSANNRKERDIWREQCARIRRKIEENQERCVNE
ncbi:hypothetical protein ACLG6S_04425 [Thermodesulfobacteriota bacterium B35]